MRVQSIWKSGSAVLFLLAMPAAVWASDVSGIAEGVVAEPVERKRPKYPTEAAQNGKEGWVDISFVIGVDGKPHDLLVEDSMGSKRFERSATSALQGWRYKPAELHGKPVQQCHNRVRLIFSLNEKNGASRSFTRRYRKGIKQAQAGDLAALKSTIETLDATTLYESMYVAYLSAVTAEIEEDTSTQLRNLRRVISYSHFDENDSTEIRGKALRRVFIILANRGEYASALQVHDEIMESDLASDVKDSSQKMAEKFQRMVDSDARLKRSITLESTREPETGLSMERHRLSRRVVGLDEIEGQLDHVDLRCDFHRAVTEAKSGTGLRLPEEWGDCRIYVFGEPGAKFKIVEYAESEFSEAPST